jgi:hypothetical protein
MNVLDIACEEFFSLIGMVKAKNIRFVVPVNNPLAEHQLLNEIKKAEIGPFISVKEGMKDFELWLEKREN